MSKYLFLLCTFVTCQLFGVSNVDRNGGCGCGCNKCKDENKTKLEIAK